MNFKIGQLITHSVLKKPRNIRQIRTDSKGSVWIGTGKSTIGWLSANECQRCGKEGVV